MLEVQERGVLQLLRDLPRGAAVLEVGGGHGQLTPALVRAGFRVVVQGSGLEAHPPSGRDRDGGRRVVSPLLRLPFDDRSFEAVVAIRLLAHVERWQDLLAEMARVARGLLVVDFPARTALQRLGPALFGAKKRLEGNTRPYFDYAPDEIESTLARLGLARKGCVREFALPMALHRGLGRPRLSGFLEGCMARGGVTQRIGSPVLLRADRSGARRGDANGEAPSSEGARRAVQALHPRGASRA